MVTTRQQDSVRALVPRVCIAVDWCGAIADAKKRMWLAEARAARTAHSTAGTTVHSCADRPACSPPDRTERSPPDRTVRSRPDRTARSSECVGAISPPGSIVRLECGRDREETVEHLIECARREPRIVVGLDFAFSFPAWFLQVRGVRNARAAWGLVDREGETWLRHCPRPFWGRPGIKRPRLPPGRSEWRATEGEAVRVRGVGPKSVFQVGGAGSVGTGSLRGMPYLRRLREAGFAIWPFDRARLPMVVEIYPRYLTGAVNKSSRVARALYLQAHHGDESRAILDAAGASEDAFDAAVSAAAMLRHRRDFAFLSQRVRNSRNETLEGRIWTPLEDPLFRRW